MDSKKADMYRMQSAEILAVREELLTDAMLDCGREFLLDFLGADHEAEVERFMKLPEFWVWFRQLWANADRKFVEAMDNKPKLLAKVKEMKIEVLTYAKFHWYELKGKRPVSSVMAAFLKSTEQKKEHSLHACKR